MLSIMNTHWFFFFFLISSHYNRKSLFHFPPCLFGLMLLSVFFYLFIYVIFKEKYFEKTRFLFLYLPTYSLKNNWLHLSGVDLWILASDVPHKLYHFIFNCLVYFKIHWFGCLNSQLPLFSNHCIFWQFNFKFK